MDLYVIGDKAKSPQKLGLARSAEEELATVRAASDEGDRLELNRSYPLAAGWDQLAFRIARIPLEPYVLQNGWYKVPPADACLEVDKAFRATQIPKPGKLPAPEYGPIMKEVRTRIFGVSQDVIAAICGCTGSRVSRWESGGLEPGLLEIHRLRAFAVAHGIPWDDNLLHRLSEDDMRLTA